MVLKASRKGLAIALSAALSVSSIVGGAALVAPQKAAAAAPTTSVEAQRFLTLYNQLTSPTNGYFSKEGIPYHAIETLLSEAPDYGHMSTSEAYSYWLWLETLYGYYTGDWTHLEKAWDNMEKYIIPVNEGDGKEEQPTMNYYDPNSPATYAPEKPYPDQYPVQLGNSKTPGKDPLDAELKATYGNNQTYLMHWLIDVDNWYGYGNLLNPSHTSTYVNTFSRGEQESVFESVTHPSQDNKTFGKTNEGFMSLFTKESQAPAAQWRYTNASDADARVIQVMYWAKQLGYNNTTYLNKAKKMGDYLRYDMYDKYFQKIGTGSGSSTPGTGKDASMYLLAWYTAWGGGLGSNGQGNWAWRIGASHAHQAYQNPVAAYALSTTAGGLIPSSPTAQQDWSTSLTRQLEFYTWLQSSEGAIGGGATNSWDGEYKAFPSGTSTFYGLGYQKAPVYHDPDSNQWFGFQAWPVERIAEMYYILASSGDKTSNNYKMAKQVMDRWVDYSLDYVFIDKKPVTDSSGYYLNAAGQRINGGANPAIATTSAPGEFYLPGTLEWTGQPDTWTSFAAYTGNPTYHTITRDPSQDLGVLGSYAKALTFYAAATKADTGAYTAQGTQAKDTAAQLLNTAWSLNDGVGIVKPEPRSDYFRFFTKETYIPSGWSGTNGQGAALPGANGVASDPAKGGNGVYISYVDQRPKITQDPMWSYLQNMYTTSYNTTTKKWENGTPTFTYHRFWAQVDIATAYAEYDRLINSTQTNPTVPSAPATLSAAAGNAQATLTWAASSGATSYNVKRASTSGGPYTTVATGVTGTTYTNTGLTNGTTYYYVVSAVNAAGESVNSAQATATPQAVVTVPAAPAALTATAGSAQATLTWTASSGATSYNVKRATTSGGPYTTVATGVTGTTYTNTGLTNGTTYYYVVTAVNSAGESANSAQASATPQAVVTVPAAPTALTATAGSAQATLTWTASSGATSYNVKRATTSGGPYTTVATGVTGTTYTNTGLTNGTTYYYVVSAVNSAGESANSAQATATPQAVVTVPSAPAGLTATAGDAQVALTWTASSGATSYNVKRSTTAGGTFTTVATGVTGTTYTNTGLTNGTTYYYVVTAVNSAGESANSAAASATPAGTVTPPAGNLVVQYKLNNNNASDNMIYATFNIKNTGTSAVSLSGLKLRYYLTKDTTSAGLNFWTDYAQVGTSSVSGTFNAISPAKTNADTYLEISFSSAAGSIAAGGQSGDIQIRIAKSDWSNLNESNDYSFDGTKSAFADWNKVTLYQGGTLVWGIEP